MQKLAVRTILVLACLIVSIVSTAHAENCSPVDFSDQLGDVRDQGDIGWCFANASADLLSHAYRNELHDQKVSATYTALNYDRIYYSKFREKLKENKSSIYGKLFPQGIGEGGLMYLTIYSSMRTGICTDKIDQLLTNYPGDKTTLMYKLQMALTLKKKFDTYQRINQHGWVLGAQPYLPVIRASNHLFDLIDDDALKVLLETTNADNFLISIADYLCHHNTYTPARDYQVQWNFSAIKYLDSTSWIRSHLGNFAADTYAKARAATVGWFDQYLVDDIDHQIDLHNPIGVLYYNTFFDGWEKPINYGADLHASVIVGRRWVPATVDAQGNAVAGACQYKIRNSWGKNYCGYANEEISGTCSEGHIWVDREKYKKYLYAATFINQNVIDPSKSVLPWESVFRDFKIQPRHRYVRAKP